MATYLELRSLFDDSDLCNRVSVAASIAANHVLTTGTPTDEQIAWAQRTINNPDGMARRLIPLVLASNPAATVQQIKAASDATLQGVVDATVTALARGMTPGV
jgi:hypothetical protein